MMDNENSVEHIITFLLRMLLGVMFFFAGLGKIQGGVAEFTAHIQNQFAGTFLPGSLLAIFGHMLPIVELLIGVLLLVGLMTRPALVLTAVTLIVLFFGMFIVRQGDTAAQNALYVLITLLALRNSEYNNLSLDHLLKRGR